jgi:hypothetical protein
MYASSFGGGGGGVFTVFVRCILPVGGLRTLAFVCSKTSVTVLE